MALYSPVVNSKPLKGSCIGNFFTPDVLHIAIPDGNDLEFRQVTQTTKHTQRFKLSLVSSGLILNAKAIPSANKSVELDTIAILGQIKTNAYVVTLKRFDTKSSELVDISSHRFDSDISEMTSFAEISVCTIPGDHYGTVYFSDGSANAYFIEPETYLKATSFALKDHNFPSPAKPFWLDPNHVALVQQSNLISHTTLLELTSHKSPKAGKRSLNIKSLGVLRDSTKRVLYVGPMPKQKKNYQVIIFYPKFSSIVEFSSKKPEEKKSYGYNLVPGTTDFTTLVADEKQTVILSSTREVYKYSAPKKELQRLMNLYVDHDITIEHISGAYFKRSKAGSSLKHIALYTLDENQSLIENILSNEDIQFEEWDNLQWLAHKFNGFTDKNTYWAHNSVFSGRTNLIASEMSDVSYCSSLDVPGLKASIRGVWIFNEGSDGLPVQLLYSTSEASGILDLMQKKNYSFQISHPDDDSYPEIITFERTLAASSYAQVTPTGILIFESGEITRATFPIVIGDIFNYTVTASGVSHLLVKRKETEFKVLHLEHTIIDVSCRDDYVAVLTSYGVAVYHLPKSGNDLILEQELELSDVGCSVSMQEDNNIFVAQSNGLVVQLPSKTTIYESMTAFKGLSSARNGGIYATDTLQGQLSWFHPQKRGTKTRSASIPGCLSAVDVARFELTIVLSTSGLNYIFWNDKPLQEFKEHLFPKIESFSSVQIRENTSYWTDSISRKLYFVILKDGEPVLNNFSSMDIPTFPVEGVETESQFYFLHDGAMLEIAKFRKSSSDSVDEDEDDEGDFWDDNDEDYEDDDDDFNVNVLVRLYDVSKGTGIKLRCESQIKIEGDPFEAIIVKFISPLRFTIFSYSSQCMTCTVNLDSSSITFGEAQETEYNVYDDHWLYSPKTKNVTVVDFHGNVYNVKDSIFNTSAYPLPQDKSKSTQFLTSDNDMVFDVKRINSDDENTGLYCALVKSREDSSRNKIVMFSFDGVSVGDVHSFFVNGQATLIEYDSRASRSDNSLVANLQPKVMVGTTHGSLYAVSLIQDNGVKNAFAEIQREVLEQLGFPEKFFNIQPDSPSDVINGALLLDGLKHESFRSLVEDNGINAAELEAFFKKLMA